MNTPTNTPTNTPVHTPESPTFVPPTEETRLPGPTVRPPRRRLHFDRRPPRHGLAVLLALALVWSITAASGAFRSVGFALALGALLLAASVSVARDRRARFLLAGAAALLPWLAIRQSPWLIAVDVVVALALLLTAATVRHDQSIATRFGGLAAGWWSAAAGLRFGPRVVATDVGVALSGVSIRRDQVVALTRAVLVAGVITTVAVMLLMSGDALFASYFDVAPIWSRLAVRAAAGLSGAVVCTMVFGAFRSPEPRQLTSHSVHPTTLLVTMFGLVLTIGTYGLVQVVAITAGAEHVERRTGLTYAEYARSGFFELVAVTAITVLVLAAARSTRERRPVGSGSLATLAGLLTFAVVSLVATSVMKLVIYADRFGLTMLRVYTITFSAWLGLVAVLTFVALIRASDRWLTPVLLLTVAIGAFAMNIVNPERLVAAHNIERAGAGSDLDLDYLARLSDDARPTILAGLDELDLLTDDGVIKRWCGFDNSDREWVATNAAITAAAVAQERFCPTD